MGGAGDQGWRLVEGPAWDWPLHLEWTETHMGRRGSGDTGQRRGRAGGEDSLSRETPGHPALQRWSRGGATHREETAAQKLLLCHVHITIMLKQSLWPVASTCNGDSRAQPAREHTASYPGLPRRATQPGSPPPVTPAGVSFWPCGWQLPSALLPV